MLERNDKGKQVSDAIATHVDKEDKTVIQRPENTTFAIPNSLGIAVLTRFPFWESDTIQQSVRKRLPHNSSKSDTD
jgi:hypothetical protein